MCLLTSSFLGAMNFGKLPYSDESGFDLDSQALVFRVEY
jgi:hypothetical protein